MRFSHILVLSLAAMATPPVLAVPLRYSDYCSPASTDVRCIGYEEDHHRTPDTHLNGNDAFSIHERQLVQPIISILAGLPIVGPLLSSIIGALLGKIGLSEIDVATASKTSLNTEQIATLANFEFALSNAMHKVLSDGSPQGVAQSKLQARGAIPLGELIAGLPLIGPFLLPLVSLLKVIGLEFVDAKQGSAFSLALLNEDQSTKLAQFQTILRQEVATFLPNSSTPDASPSPESNNSNSDAPSPDNVPPEEATGSIPMSPPASK